MSKTWLQYSRCADDLLSKQETSYGQEWAARGTVIASPARGGSCVSPPTSTSSTAFERTSKRGKGFPSEAHVKRGRQIVHGDKELEEKLGRNDPCPCGSTRRFQELLHA